MTPNAPVDAERPNIARVYDYLLGGSHIFVADPVAAQEFQARPRAAQTMRLYRAFAGRAVRYLTRAGIGQFLAIGPGIPTMGNVHEVAHRYAASARVVCIDNDEVAVLHHRAILDRNENAVAIQADLRRPTDILSNPQLQATLDLSRPAAVLLVALLHFLPYTANPAVLVAQLPDALAPGSYLVPGQVAAYRGAGCGR